MCLSAQNTCAHSCQDLGQNAAMKAEMCIIHKDICIDVTYFFNQMCILCIYMCIYIYTCVLLFKGPRLAGRSRNKQNRINFSSEVRSSTCSAVNLQSARSTGAATERSSSSTLVGQTNVARPTTSRKLRTALAHVSVFVLTIAAISQQKAQTSQDLQKAKTSLPKKTCQRRQRSGGFQCSLRRFRKSAAAQTSKWL